MTRIIGKAAQKAAAKRAGAYLRELRITAGLTQSEAGHKIGKKDDLPIRRWELGITSPSLEDLKRLVEIYGVSVQDVLRVVEPEEERNWGEAEELRYLDPIAARALAKFPRSVQRTFVLEYLPAIRRMGLTLAETEEKYRTDEEQDKTR